MQNVAQHWNECIQIAEAERHEAIQEIVRLEDKVNHTKEVLRKSMQVLTEKDSKIQESERRCHKLEKEGSLAEKERQKLYVELESLRSDLAKSQDHAKSMQERYRKNRAKLNEAIEEQQALFSRTRVLHQETNEELQKEKDRRAADAKAVEVALEASQKKREELKNCIEEYRAKTEQEMKQSKIPQSSLPGLMTNRATQKVTPFRNCRQNLSISRRNSLVRKIWQSNSNPGSNRSRPFWIKSQRSILISDH
jgi:chromosome segregation ATPase